MIVEHRGERHDDGLPQMARVHRTTGRPALGDPVGPLDMELDVEARVSIPYELADRVAKRTTAVKRALPIAMS